MTKLFIPACGDRLILTEQWEFGLYLERRNVKFAQSLGLVDEKFNYWQDGYEKEPDARRLSVQN